VHLRVVVWVIIIFFFLLSLLTWLFISPLVLEIDTRVPKAEMRWISIGKVVIWFENEWWLCFRVLFLSKTIRVATIKGKKKGKNDAVKQKKRGKTGLKRLPARIFRVLGTFRVVKWKLAVDTGDYALNGILYPLNFLPPVSGHLYFNFNDDNYLHLEIRNRPWNIIYAFLK
jgi:hypothetical protein